MHRHWQLPRGQLVGFVLIILLVGGLAVFSLFQLNAVLTAEALSDREAQASLTAAVLRERFDRVADLSTALSNGVRFREHIEAGRWEEAVTQISGIFDEFPFIDRIFLTDSAGVLRADVPAAPDVRGINFAYRDWYQGASVRAGPYVSNVYQRTAEPEPKVIAVAVGVSSTIDPAKNAAFLVLQIRLGTLLSWAEETDYGTDAYAVFVDRVGAVAAHPKFDPQGDIVNFSAVPWVQESSRTSHGIGVYDDPIEGGRHLVAYARVPEYGWTVGISQGYTSAFAARDRLLTGVRILFGVIIVIIILLVVSIIRGFVRLQVAKSEFVSAASHQLKTPLSGLRWTLESLNIPPEVLTDRQRTYLANLTQYGERLVQSIDGLLNLSRIDLGAVEVRPEETNVRDFLKGIQSDMAGYAAIYARDIRLEVADNVPATVALDRQLVYHVVQNFLSNAIEYATPKTPVTVKCATDPAGVRITVHNTGEPIPKLVQSKLFEKFYRAPEARAMKANGTGIGLYVAKSFALRWGGTIGFDAEGRDIVFWVTI